MEDIIKLLRSEIARLEVELSELTNERSSRVALLDAHLADVRQRLNAAELMLATYCNENNGHVGLVSRSAAHQEPNAQLGSADPTWLEIEAVSIPQTLRGRQLRPGSKRARIIKAAKAFLQLRGSATRSELVEFMKRLGLLGNEKNPSSYLSVTLWQATEILVTDGDRWRLRG